RPDLHDLRVHGARVTDIAVFRGRRWRRVSDCFNYGGLILLRCHSSAGAMMMRTRRSHIPSCRIANGSRSGTQKSRRILLEPRGAPLRAKIIGPSTNWITLHALFFSREFHEITNTQRRWA